MLGDSRGFARQAAEQALLSMAQCGRVFVRKSGTRQVQGAGIIPCMMFVMFGEFLEGTRTKGIVSRR